MKPKVKPESLIVAKQPAELTTQSTKAPQAPTFDLKALSRQWAKEALENLNRNVRAEAEADEKAKAAKP